MKNGSESIGNKVFGLVFGLVSYCYYNKFSSLSNMNLSHSRSEVWWAHLIPLLHFHKSKIKVLAELCFPLEALGGNSVSHSYRMEVSAFSLAEGHFQLLKNISYLGWWPSSSIVKFRNDKARLSHTSNLYCIFYCPVSLTAARRGSLLLNESNDLNGPTLIVQDNVCILRCILLILSTESLLSN